MFKNSLSFLFLALCASVTLAARGGPKGDCHLKQIDVCLDQIETISNDPNSSELLKTEQGLQKICKAAAGTADCMENSFKKCATPTHRELFKLFHDHFTHSLNSFCQGPEQKKKFLSESTCIVDKVLKKDAYKKKCVNNYLATLDRTNAETDTAVKINTACCAYNRWEECMYNLINKDCGLNARNSMEFFVSKALGTTSSAICNDASFKYTSKKCTKLYAPPGTKSKGRNSDNPITKYIISYMGFLFN